MGVVVSPSHVVSATPSSSHSAPAPVWGPSHGTQSSMNCPSVGPFHGVQSFRNRLLQRGSPMGSQALPANLLQRGLPSPRGHRSWQKPAPVRAAHGVTASFRHPPAPAWGPPWAAGGDLLHRGPPWAAGAQPASPWSSSRVARDSLLWHLEHLLPLPPPSSLTLVSAELSLSHHLTPLSSVLFHCSFFPPFNYHHR